MKKLLLIISFISIAFAASSYSISEEMATQMASRFFGGYYVSNSSSVTLVSKGVDQTTKASATVAPYYIFNHVGGGYVIIAGEDTMKPVIGYSYTGSIDVNNMPETLKWWLNNVSESVDYIRAKGIMPTRERLAEWTRVGLSTKAGATEVVNLNTVCWSQGAPFYYYCPPNEGNLTTETHSVAGCVPIAICEVMIYYGWPSKGEGTTPAYTSGKYSIAANTLGTEYDWAMLKKFVDKDSNPGSNTAERRTNSTNASKLVGDVGKSVKAVYTLSSTSASSENIVRLFTQYFKYNKAARFTERGSYGDAEWEEMLKAELDKGRPILYSGQSSDGGHQFVLDGYDTDDYFHINWGWGPSSNGFFWINYDFRSNQAAIFDFVPDKDGTSVLAPGDIRLIKTANHNGYELTTADYIEPNVAFSMTVCGIANFSSNTYSGSRPIRLARVGKDGKIKEFCSSDTKTFSTLNPGEYFTSSFSFTNQKVTACEMGDQIMLCRQDFTGGNYSVAEVDIDGTVLTGYALVRNEFIDMKESYKVGDKFETRLRTMLTPYNDCAKDDAFTSRWRFYKDGELVADFVKGSEGNYYTIEETGNYTVVAIVSIYGVPDRSITASFVVK